ncbi:hypothetical protein [Neptuniibacter caesariensis]|uniref:Roadblock/LAMTOR2 domain-containing protein n=1 Tax=Neptuniibacter caesariensis TaxID=207954 RepID=A0A7U8C7X1_NEPCE|nr:hypothetical protein [Neptuniibacter caesariensis]EAR61461.1 hypothetical protein MED92_18183 [Oceanospirillum sp. MED92] [Neptuniibacter caesariensis]
MNELLSRVDKPGVIECSCLLKGKEILVTSFTKDYKSYETVGKQAFLYVFQSAVKNHSRHNEAHLHIGDMRLSGFKLKPGLVLVCLSKKDANIMKVRHNMHEFYRMFLQSRVKKSLTT